MDKSHIETTVDSTISRPKQAFWLINSSGWFLMGIINVVFQTNFFQQNYGAFAYTSIIVLAGFTVSFLTRFVILKTRLMDFKMAVIVPSVLAIVLMGSLVTVLIFYTFNFLLLKEEFDSLQGFIGTWFNLSLVFAIWMFIYISYLLFEKQRRLSEQKFDLLIQLKEAELNNLRKQLSPHFLFNAINNIRSLILIDPEEARVALLDISDLLRYALNYQKKERVTLAEEMEVVQSYVNINKIHLKDNVNFEIDIAESLLDLSIPPMSVQLLVENAIKHGTLMNGGVVKVTAITAGNKHVITVVNPGEFLVSKIDEGIGLDNLRKRLSAQYGAKTEFSISEIDTNVHAQITIEV